MKDSLATPSFVGPQDWRGPRVTVADLPALSQYAARALQAESNIAADGRTFQHQALAQWADSPWTPARLTDSLTSFTAAATGDEAQRLAVALRRLRRRVLLTLIARDATGRAELPEVVSTMTALAELTLQSAVAAGARELSAVHGVPIGADGVPQDLLVVGMGKLGGGELNVSSDIDLIFVYDQDGETDRASVRGRLSNHEFFAQLGRRVIALLNDVTADGFVFRVDMRLRPNGAAGPLAVSNAMLEEYLMAQGREWERFAWLKGRIVSTPVFASTPQFEAQCGVLESIVRPFVFRKYLDFGAIAALRDLHRLIRAEAARRSSFAPHGPEQGIDDVKLGRGGIRELEFIAQTFQIVRGGRDPGLRSKSTLQTLMTLAKLGVLPSETCGRLATSYVFLRNLEHALQYVDDAQTHRVPADVAGRERVARLLGAGSATAMITEYRAVQALVVEVFDGVFAEPTGGDPEVSFTPAIQDADDGALIEDLGGRGFADPAATAQRLRAVLDSRRMQATTGAARTGMERLLRRALQAAIERSRETGAAHDIGPDQHFARFAQLADVIAGRHTYIALLNQFPQAFDKVMRMLAASRWATDYLVRHPMLLDELLDQRLLEHEPDWPSWSTAVRQQLTEADGDQERQINLLRDAHHAQVFRLLVADLDGRLTVERLSDHLSALADATLQMTIEYAWRSLARRHSDIPRFAVIGYGKLGGKELGYESDLDVIFLYDDADAAAAEAYSLLARRLMTWLTTQTSSGKLFEIDLRLRPDGNAGLMVSSFEAFACYQRNEDGHGAWPWEHQALTRARHSAGDAHIGERFEAERRHILMQRRDTRQLCTDVLEMRARMLDGHPNPTALFDVKHDRGGMVDVEFIVQFLVLAHAHRHAELVRNAGNIALLQMAGQLQLIDASLAREVADAYRTFRSIQHRLRLNGSERARVAHQEVQRETAAVTQLWNAVFTPEATSSA
ncbi:MAG TPA: bifunctional [glutamate--ammonia ligase]-adenylyl-L-tyrosine phosphorylase/[glutamate--ammonia-ligase] adenylyltransferase [Burkholderiaceae bacterium]|nr:bifunctional [glutamate--ammonia ligase]-adenylyl-L-tyrosine phosphorylase/[glutamate--ammonia-ligase] adenylyltransferase [Burkholderiaceae bacterium]